MLPYTSTLVDMDSEVGQTTIILVYVISVSVAPCWLVIKKTLKCLIVHKMVLLAASNTCAPTTTNMAIQENRQLKSIYPMSKFKYNIDDYLRN